MMNKDLLQEIYDDCNEVIRNSDIEEEYKTVLQGVQADVIELAGNLGITIKSPLGVDLPLEA